MQIPTRTDLELELELEERRESQGHGPHGRLLFSNPGMIFSLIADINQKNKCTVSIINYKKIYKIVYINIRR